MKQENTLPFSLGLSRKAPRYSEQIAQRRVTNKARQRDIKGGDGLESEK